MSVYCNNSADFYVEFLECSDISVTFEFYNALIVKPVNLRYHAAEQRAKSFHDIQKTFQYKIIEILF